MNNQNTKAQWVVGFAMAVLSVGCATSPGSNNGVRTRHHLGETLAVDHTPRPIVSGQGVLHAYSRFAGAAIVVVRSDADPAQACSTALAHGRSIVIPADRSVKVLIASDELACVVGESPRKGEIFWHTHAKQDDSSALYASGI
jgi:hypothetical protein